MFLCLISLVLCPTLISLVCFAGLVRKETSVLAYTWEQHTINSHDHECFSMKLGGYLPHNKHFSFNTNIHLRILVEAVTCATAN